MKSIIYGPENEPVWKKEEDGRVPRCGRNQVLVRVHAVGLNPVDAKGVIGDKLPHNWTTVQSMARRCIVQSKVIGFDFAGVVEGTKIDHNHDNKNNNDDDDNNKNGAFVTGDRVYGILPPSRYGGTLQERIVVPVDQLTRIPESMSFNQAAALPLVGITAVQCLRGAGWGDDDDDHHHHHHHHNNNIDDNNNDDNKNKKLLVIGASGGTGHVAVQVGHCLQPQAQIVAVCSERNADFVRNLVTSGNDNKQEREQQQVRRPHLTILDYHDDDFEQQLQAAGPYDVVMDCVTSGDPRDQSMLDYRKLLLSDDRFMKPRGQYRCLGGFVPDWFRASLERITGAQSVWSNPSAKLFWIQMHGAAPILQQLAGWISQGTLHGAHVAKTVPFTPEGVQRGFEALLGRRMVGKVVVEFFSSNDKIAQTEPDTVQSSKSTDQGNNKKQS